MLDFYNDTIAQIEYNSQNNKFGFSRQAIGAHDYIDIDVVTTLQSSANSIYVSNTIGNDSTGDGTILLPYKTILKACNSCTAIKCYVVILDSYLYAENLMTLENDYFSGLYAADGEIPYLSLRTLDYTESNSNTIFINKTIAETGADGTRENPVAIIAAARALCDASHQNMMIDDSETYEEAGWEFAGNVKNLRAKIGEKPVVIPTFNKDLFDINQSISQTDLGYNFCGGGILTDSNYIYILSTFLLSPTGYNLIYRFDYDYNYIDTIISNAGIKQSSFCFLQNGNIIIVYVVYNTFYGYYKIIDKNGNEIVSQTSFHAAQTAMPTVRLLNNNNIVISYIDADDSNKGKYLILNQTTFEEIKIETTFSNDSLIDSSLSILATNEVILLYSINDAGTLKLYFQSIDGNDYSEIKSKTFISEWGSNYTHAFNVLTSNLLDNDILMIAYRNGTSGNFGYVVYNTQNSEIIINDTSIDSSGSWGHWGTAIGCLGNNKILLCYGWINSGSTQFHYYQVFDYSSYLLKISDDSIMNGIVFSFDIDSYFPSSFLGASASLNISYCTFNGIENADVNQKSWIVYSDSEIDINHCDIYDCDKAIYSETNNALIHDNLFYRINSNYVAWIKGASATGDTIQIEHNTFFDCYAGLQLENNNGSEVVKNNIFHDCDVYDINAETSITQTNSLYTGLLNNVVNGSGVIKANPLFINEGSLDPADTNLQIKLSVLGYPSNSPAYSLGDDDPDRDAGAWDIIPIGSATTWESFTFEKPGKGVKVHYEPIGALINKRKDGSIESTYDDWMEVIDLEFEGILNADYNNFLDMLTCRENEIRFYPDFVTNPTHYNLYKIIYENFNADASHYKLTRTGRQKFNISFARAYEQS